MSMSINRNMEPRHRQPKGGTCSLVMRSVNVSFDTLPTAFPYYAIPTGQTDRVELEIDLVKLAALLGVTITAADVVSGGLVKYLPFHVTQITAARAGTQTRTMVMLRAIWHVSNAGKLIVDIDWLNTGSVSQQATLQTIDTTGIEIHVAHNSTAPLSYSVTANYSTLT